MKTKRSIVKDAQAFYLMAANDFRHPHVNPKSGYTFVTEGQLCSTRQKDPGTGYTVQTFKGDNGRQYTVFLADGSAREAK